MKFGICTAPGALGDPARFLDVLAEAGADYVEWTVGSLMASEGEFEKLCAIAQKAPIKPEAFCVFLPPHHRITGPGVNLASALEYAGEAVRRIGQIGGDIVVLGRVAPAKCPKAFQWSRHTASSRSSPASWPHAPQKTALPLPSSH